MDRIGKWITPCQRCPKDDHWGSIEVPYVAYYGQVSGDSVASWWHDHGPRLFSRNLRHLIPVSDVNEDIADTLVTEPENFWYFNNGITVVCQRVHKKPMSGTD